MRQLFAIPALALLLAGCVTYQDQPVVSDGPIRPEGSVVALGEPVRVADVVLTAMSVAEDSRCPINARCVWAGEVTVVTRIDGAGWRETVPMTLGEPVTVRDYRLALVSAEPGRTTDAPTPSQAYRFAYEGGSIGVVP